MLQNDEDFFNNWTRSFIGSNIFFFCLLMTFVWMYYQNKVLYILLSLVRDTDMWYNLLGNQMDFNMPKYLLLNILHILEKTWQIKGQWIYLFYCGAKVSLTVLKVNRWNSHSFSQMVSPNKLPIQKCRLKAFLVY